MASSKNKPVVPPLAIIAFGILAVSTASIFIRFAQGEAPSLVIAAYRLTLAALIIAPIALFRHREELASLTRLQIGLALLSGFFLAVHFITWITSLEYTTVASSVVLVSTSPLWVALLAPFTLKEPVTRLILLGLILALAGGIIVGISDTCTWSGSRLICPEAYEFLQGRAFIGDLLALAGAIMAACYLIVGRGLRRSISLVSYIFLVYSMAAVILVIVMFAAGQVPWGYSPDTYLWLLLLAIIPQLLGHSSFNWSLGYLSAAFVSITLLGEPIGSTILAYILLSETPGAVKIIGAILILVGIFIASKSEAKHPSERN
jgi:drug/metabolite transporter (DMT)-like permease